MKDESAFDLSLLSTTRHLHTTVARKIPLAQPWPRVSTATKLSSKLLNALLYITSRELNPIHIPVFDD